MFRTSPQRQSKTYGNTKKDERLHNTTLRFDVCRVGASRCESHQLNERGCCKCPDMHKLLAYARTTTAAHTLKWSSESGFTWANDKMQTDKMRNNATGDALRMGAVGVLSLMKWDERTGEKHNQNKGNKTQKIFYCNNEINCKIKMKWMKDFIVPGHMRLIRSAYSTHLLLSHGLICWEEQKGFVTTWTSTILKSGVD